MSELLNTLRTLPLFIEGGDSSLWPCREPAAHWDLIEAVGPELAKRRWVNVHDLLEAVGELPSRPTVEPVDNSTCAPNEPGLT